MFNSAILRGFFSYLPGSSLLLKRRREHSGTINARYCYSAWLRHLVKLFENGLVSIPRTVAEIGPGASLGVGLAVLLSGSEKYYAFDIIKHTDTERNLKVFNELIDLFNNKEPIPGPDEFKSLKPYLNNYEFPHHILKDHILSNSLDSKRIDEIRNSIIDLEVRDNSKLIEYYAPWNLKNRISSKVDLIFSQAVMEHVMDLNNTYKKMYSLLNSPGYISNQIDFKSHETSNLWYGHRLYSDWLWNIIMHGRLYAINRATLHDHKEIIKSNNFSVIDQVDIRNDIKLKDRHRLIKKKYSEEDLEISASYILAKKS